MTNLGNVSVRRPSRQTRLNIQSGQVPADFTFPGEPKDGPPSPQMQSWTDAGQRFSDFASGVGDFFNGIVPAVTNWYEKNVFPYTPGGRGMGGSFMDYVNASPVVAGLRGLFNERPTGSTAPMSLSDFSQATGDQTAAMQEEPDYLAQAAAILGGGPNYASYRQALMDQATALNAQIQAMYNRLGEEAGANVARLQDIYGGAQTGVGDVYSSAAGNVQQAYQTANQQAADQLARLGIEAAAPQVIPFTASQQAQALAGLEQGRAGGLSALQRYGASAQDFGSQMAQVAQQQGTETNAALINSLNRMLAESLAAEAQGAYDARRQVPSMARDLAELSGAGRTDPRAEAEFLYQQEQDDANIFRQYYQDYYAKTNNQASARELARQDAIAGIMGPRIQQRALADPNFVPAASQ